MNTRHLAPRVGVAVAALEILPRCPEMRRQAVVRQVTRERKDRPACSPACQATISTIAWCAAAESTLSDTTHLPRSARDAASVQATQPSDALANSTMHQNHSLQHEALSIERCAPRAVDLLQVALHLRKLDGEVEDVFVWQLVRRLRLARRAVHLPHLHKHFQLIDFVQT